MLSLMITGFDGEPERISEILGIRPTSICRVGEISLSGRPAKTSSWLISLEADHDLQPGADHHRLLEELLGLLVGKEPRFAQLKREKRPERMSIYGGFYADPNHVEGIWLEPEQMRLLADCGIGWGVDIFNAKHRS